MAKVPINPSVLQWAMHQAAVGVEALSEATKRSPLTVEAWLQGTAQPHHGDLRSIGAALNRSPHFFLRSSIPDETHSPNVARRSALNVPADIATEERFAIQKAENARLLANWLAEASDYKPSPFPDLPADEERAGKVLREWLNINVRRDQVAVTSKSGIFKNIRRACEAKGVIVLLENFGKTAPQGFSIPDTRAPVIVVNGSYDLASVRSYTILHELCHLSSSSSSFDHNSDPAFERWAERVGAASLIPHDDLKLYLSKYRKLTFVNDGDTHTVDLISKRYGSSWESTARRLKELGYARHGLIAAVTGREVKETGFRPGGGLTRPELRIQEFGTTYPALLAEGVSRGKITSLEVRKQLRLSSESEWSAISADLAVSS